MRKDRTILEHPGTPPLTMAEKPTIYVETTIPSFLTARPSGDLITAARQLVARQWWEQDNSIVDEVRKARREILESFGWDFEKMSRDVMARQEKSGHPRVSVPLRAPEVAETAKPKVAETGAGYGAEERAQ